jgi:hypothetical protein
VRWQPEIPQTVSVASKDPVEQLVGAVREYLGDGPFTPAPGWTHMGAAICDAVLQRRMNYKAVVLPRVAALKAGWPEADTVSRFRQHIAHGDLQAILDINSPARLSTTSELADHLAAAGVETHTQLRVWLDIPEHAAGLRKIKWIGPKTVDYLGILVGRRSVVAIDTRLRRFAELAGVTEPDALLSKHLVQAAGQLECDPTGLDHAIWKYMEHRPTHPCLNTDI